MTIRDSTYVLDELWKNATELPIREHTTDTAGATEIILALFDLLGYRFTPRLRDLSDRRLFTSGTIDRQRYPRLHAQLTYRIKRPRRLDWWDEILRAAGSLQLGWVTAALLVQKLQAYPQQNALARALQEYGRLARTRHRMRWYAHTEDRRRIMRQLKKGEALHDLRAALVIANKGHRRHPRGEQLAPHARCLNLVTNAVIVWNTVYMAAGVEQLKQEGYPVQASDARISGPHAMPISTSMANTISIWTRCAGVRAYARSGSRAVWQASAQNFSYGTYRIMSRMLLPDSST